MRLLYLSKLLSSRSFYYLLGDFFSGGIEKYMNRVNAALINMLSSSLNCSLSSNVELEPQEWQHLYEEAIAHQIHLTIFEEANKYGKSVNPALFEKWKGLAIYQTLENYRRFSIIGELFKAFEEANIPVMALKGLFVKHLYPKLELRTMGDIDIFIRRGSLDEAIGIIKSFGYKKTERDDPKHYTFYHEQYIPIELHVSLVTESRRKLASSINDDIWEFSVSYNADGANILVPNDINHLIYCCIHMTNHFGKGGFGLRQLSDFNLLARKLGKDADWDNILDRAYSYGIGKFMKVMLCVCHNLFSLEIPSCLKKEFEDNLSEIEKLIQSILDAGVFGRKNPKVVNDRVLATYIHHNNSNKIKSFKYLFPSRNELDVNYSYAKRHAFLLPMAWLHRMLRYIFRTDLKLKYRIPDTKSINEYVKLFKWLDIK